MVSLGCGDGVGAIVVSVGMKSGVEAGANVAIPIATFVTTGVIDCCFDSLLQAEIVKSAIHKRIEILLEVIACLPFQSRIIF